MPKLFVEGYAEMCIPLFLFKIPTFYPSKTLISISSTIYIIIMLDNYNTSKLIFVHRHHFDDEKTGENKMNEDILDDEFEDFASYEQEREDQEKYCGDDADLEEE